MLLWLKYLYQTIAIRSTLFFYAIASKKYDQEALAAKRLRDRGFSWQPGKPTKVFAIFAINNWESVLLEPLGMMGELFHFTWSDGKYFFKNKREWSVFHQKLNADMLASFNQMYNENANIIVFIYAADFSVSSETVKAMTRSNTLLISFCWDDILYFKGRVKGQPVGISEISKYVDINLTFAEKVIPRYNYQQSPCFFWKGLPLNIMVNDSLPKINQQKFYVLFIGSAYGWRKKFIEELIRKGVTIICYGEGWPNGPISFSEMEEQIRTAPITLGFSNVGYTKNITTIKGRVFEVPLFGGLLLNQQANGLDEYFEEGKEILTFGNLQECYDQILFVEQNPMESEWIRKEGHKKMVLTGTWKSRFAYLQSLINSVNKKCIV